jgi:murein DD-endopeptidase MepM/ murein hydrolase activator NlpD
MKVFQEFWKFLVSRIKINVLSPETYEPFFGIEITRLTVLSGVFVFFVLSAILTYLMLSFTPLKAFLPDSLRTADKEFLIEQQLRIDSLAYQVRLSQQYADDLKSTLMGENSRLDQIADSIPKVEKAENLISTETGDAERELMEKIQNNLNQNSGIAQKENNQFGLFFFAPVKGVMSQKMSANHPAVDIVTKAGEPVKSILDGRIIFSEYSKISGFTVIIYHNAQFISVYKHLQTTSKKSGERVKVGEVIGLVGNTGTHTTGPHLHFELIFEGRYVNPTDFISFK